MGSRAYRLPSPSRECCAIVSVYFLCMHTINLTLYPLRISFSSPCTNFTISSPFSTASSTSSWPTPLQLLLRGEEVHDHLSHIFSNFFLPPLARLSPTLLRHAEGMCPTGYVGTCAYPFLPVRQHNPTRYCEAWYRMTMHGREGRKCRTFG